ncbi:MAG: hypothetical protein CME25_11415 [Gemmatimonadetes bacterium]|nr:hypothetical protein [Gemmatimonadota bacterium]
MKADTLDEAQSRVQNHYVSYLRDRLRVLPTTRIGNSFPGSRDAWESHATNLRPKLREIYNFPEEDGDLNHRTVGSIERPGFTIRKVIYDSEPGSSVPAHLYVPKDIQFPAPAIIFPSGHGGSKSSFFNQYGGQLYAKAGIICLIPDPSGEEERDEETRMGIRGHRQDFRVDRCFEYGRSVIGKLTYDIVRGIDYLCSLPEVDSDRIGCAGHSLGCTITMNVLCTDTRLALSLPASWVTHFDYIVGDLSCEWRPPGLKHYVDMPEQIALGAPRCATLILAGEWDYHKSGYEGLLETCRRVRQVYEVCGVGEKFDVHITPKGGHRPYFVNKESFRWVRQHLGMAHYSADEVEALPEIYLGDWAAKQNVEIERAYGTHKAYAGTVAVDVDVQYIPPEDLACLPPGGASNPQFSMAGWMSDISANLPPSIGLPSSLEAWEAIKGKLVEYIAEVVPLRARPSSLETETVGVSEESGYQLEEIRYGELGLSSYLIHSNGTNSECAIYLDVSRTKEGALLRDDVRNLLHSGVAVLALSCVGLDDSALLLGESSTSSNVHHVIESVDLLQQRGFQSIHCMGFVDDVALFAGILDERIGRLRLGSRGGTQPHPVQRYRQEGVVPGLNKITTYAGLLSLVAPRPLEVSLSMDALPEVQAVFSLYGKPRRFKLLNCMDAESTVHRTDCPH